MTGRLGGVPTVGVPTTGVGVAEGMPTGTECVGGMVALRDGVLSFPPLPLKLDCEASSIPSDEEDGDDGEGITEVGGYPTDATNWG